MKTVLSARRVFAAAGAFAASTLLLSPYDFAAAASLLLAASGEAAFASALPAA